jgi:hypothetical protein
MAARKPRRRITRVASRRTTPRRVTRGNGGNVWSREEISFLRKYYKQYPTSWVARQLGRTAYAVRYKASDLSIKKARPSVWRANTGSNQPKITGRQRMARQSTSRQTQWSRRPARRAKSGRRMTRKSMSRRTTRRH